MQPLSLKSSALVSFQFIAIGLLIIELYFNHPLQLHPFPLLLQLIAIGVGIWAMFTIGLNNFNIRPDPKPHFTLITHGPYHYIRHPMYFSLLLFFGVAIVQQFSFSALSSFAALLITLLVKLHYEEQLLNQQHPDYSGYRQHTKRLIPFLY